jgi:hypothetical protein
LASFAAGRSQIEEFVTYFFHCYHNVTYTPRGAVGDRQGVAWEWTLEANYARTSHTGVPGNGSEDLYPWRLVHAPS